MNDVHEYYGDNDNPELGWQRVFTIPTASIDTKQDPFSTNDFLDRTKNKKGTYGNMLDYSRELSDKRSALCGGKDPIKEQFYKQYSKDRNGAKHPDQMKKTFENKHIKAEL
jgi:hypothetical protein